MVTQSFLTKSFCLFVVFALHLQFTSSLNGQIQDGQNENPARLNPNQESTPFVAMNPRRQELDFASSIDSSVTSIIDLEQINEQNNEKDCEKHT